MSDLKPSDLLDLDALLSDEERQIRDLAREWVRDRILPEVDDPVLPAAAVPQLLHDQPSRSLTEGTVRR